MSIEQSVMREAKTSDGRNLQLSGGLEETLWEVLVKEFACCKLFPYRVHLAPNYQLRADFAQFWKVRLLNC